MRPSRRLAAVLFLPAILTLQAWAWWGTHPILVDGHYAEIAAYAGTTERTLTLVGIAAAAAAAVAVGPWLVLAGGLFLVALSWFLVPVVGPAWMDAARNGAALGYGVIAPCLWAAAVLPFPRPYEAARNAMVIGLWALAGGTAIAGPVLWEMLLNQGGGVLAYGSAATLAGVAASLAALLWAGWFLTRDPDADAEAVTERLDLPVVATAAALGVVVVLPYSAAMTWFDAAAPMFSGIGGSYSSATGYVFGVPVYLPTLFSGAWWELVNPAFVGWFGLLVSACFVVLATARRNVPALRVAGLGLAILSLGVTLLDPNRAPEQLVAVFALLALGEVLVGPLLLSRIGGDHHWRATTAVVGAWMAARITTAAGLTWLRDNVPAASDLHLWGALAGAAVGLVLIAAAGPLQRRLYVPDVPTEEAAPAVAI